MNRTRTYSEFKKLLNTELEMFNFCLSTNTIFKSEFTKLRKMFKGLLRKEKLKKNECYIPNNPNYKEFIKIEKAFDTYINYNGHYIPFSQITDFNLHLFQFDYPNLQEQYDKLLSMKKSIRSGRRPKDLEKDYEAERLRKAQEEDKATCGICNDYWELVDIRDQKNIIHDHGFNIQWGYRNNVCFGARYKCWEKSPESKKEYVKRVLKPLLEKVILDKPNELTLERLKEHNAKRLIATKELNNLSDGVYREWYKHKNRKDYLRFIESEYCPENVKIVHNLKLLSARPTIRFVGQQFATKLYDKELVLSYLLHLWITYKQQLESEIARFETAIKNWKLQPTPRERLGK